MTNIEAVGGESKLKGDSVYLVDLLQKAQVSAPAENYVGIHRVTIERDHRSSIFQHPPSKITFQPIRLGSQPRLLFACGIKQSSWSRLKNGIVFEIFISAAGFTEKRIFQRVLTPGARKDDRHWIDEEIDLSRFSNQDVHLTFSTSVPRGGNAAYCWSAWGNPQIQHLVPKTEKSIKSTSPAHIFLITSDALRPDYLGCYGNDTMRTPHIDQLAENGSLFLHARAQSPSSLGSYTSLLLSLSPLDHKITTEWGCMPAEPLSLPKYLGAHGYHTVLVNSEIELAAQLSGITDLFKTTSVCLGNPAQDGGMTTRIALKHIEQQEGPTFFWIQYFDTHPPVTPPEPYRSMYYEGNPQDESKRYHSELVPRIRGVETIQELSNALPLLEQGMTDIFITAKLEATVQALQGKLCSEPDLATHLKQLGPRACRNMSLADFATWLDVQVNCIKAGQVTDELLRWLKELLPILDEIEADITAWLDGVVDFRYPVSQYMGAISYFDAQVGALCDYLKNNDLYEHSTIIVTSPHGEIMYEQENCFHHHTLMESCLRIPMIIKPSASAENGQTVQRGQRIDGIFDSIDLFPTLIDGLGLPALPDLAGVSRWQHVVDGSSIPDHDSFSLGNSFSMAGIARAPYKFLKVGLDHASSPKWRWRKGDRILFDLQDTPIDTNNLIESFPHIALELEQRLEQWLGQDVQNNT
jgi:hypothetical protein